MTVDDFRASFTSTTACGRGWFNVLKSALGVVLAVSLIGSVAACEREQTPAATTELPEGSPDMPVPDQVVENGEHIITIQGVKKAVMIAEQLYFYNQTNAVHGDTIQVNFFDDSGTFVSMLTASKGEMNQDTQEMTARGNVFVREVAPLCSTPSRCWIPIPTPRSRRSTLLTRLESNLPVRRTVGNRQRNPPKPTRPHLPPNSRMGSPLLPRTFQPIRSRPGNPLRTRIRRRLNPTAP
jgi:LPS export ABC transporter protein LptC